GRAISEWLAPGGSREGDFRATSVAHVPGESGTATDVALTPFYRTHGRRYSIYFDVITPAELEARDAQVAAERERVRRLGAGRLGFVQPWHTAPEREA